jgi:beta-galactosidase
LKLGVCYYPEQWPESDWADDAKRMREAGISHVRLAEFSWAMIEPSSGNLQWAWLDRAIDALAHEGLAIILCTPTATPPKWLIDQHPDVLAVDAHGNTRNFGSRRHYCFSSGTYRVQSQRITRLMAERYGNNPHVVAWQTDNEYGCHDTVLSYSVSARQNFRRWLTTRYLTIAALNTAWGTTFWSQCYRHFDEIDPPASTVTEANPSHRLDWQRFASDEVVTFNRKQVEILRALSPGRPITHNFMGFFTQFNHHDVSADLDIAAWDSYPLGFTQMFFLTTDEKTRWATTGYPDISSFHHDLYRGMSVDRVSGKHNHRWWVMEQQPGPVNWANWNPAPENGMVRLWTWQAFAHGAELVSYFRWRQAPFAQEQMHAGLLRPDRSDDQGLVEATIVGRELTTLAKTLPITDLAVRAKVALVFDYVSLWMTEIQPQGADYNSLELCFRLYSALRQLGLDVDIVDPKASLTDYRLIVLPAMSIIAPELLSALQASTAEIVLAPRAGSKTIDMQIPANLAPGVLTDLAGVTVMRVASLPPGIVANISGFDDPITATRWREQLRLNSAIAEATFTNGEPAISRNSQTRTRYVGAWLSNEGWQSVLSRAAKDAGLNTVLLPDTLRISTIGNLIIACNFADAPTMWRPTAPANCVIGEASIAQHDVAVWQLTSAT